MLLTYNHYTLQNDMALELVPICKEKSVGLMNAAPFSARLLTGAPLPEWHKATPEVREIAKKASEHCTAAGTDIAQLALQFSIGNPDMATCVTGSANPGRVAQWIDWAETPMDEQLLAEVLEILKPISQLVLHRRPSRKQRRVSELTTVRSLPFLIQARSPCKCVSQAIERPTRWRYQLL